MTMKLTTGRIIEGFAILPSLNLSWVRTPKGTIHFLQLAWLYWYIQVQQNFDKYGLQKDKRKTH